MTIFLTTTFKKSVGVPVGADGRGRGGYAPVSGSGDVNSHVNNIEYN
jgi:hypothetical protein